MANWYYRDGFNAKEIQSINDFPEGCVGFIYKITNLDNNKFYIGKKQLESVRNIKLTLKEIATHTGKGRKPKKKKVVKESDWQNYFGSCIPLQKDIKALGEDHFKREIIRFCYSKKQMSYYEVRAQIFAQVLEKPEHTYNENIGGKYFPADLKENTDEKSGNP